MRWRSLWETFVEAPIQSISMPRSQTPMLPALLQVQQHCQDLERVLRGQALPTSQRTRLRSRMATITARRRAQPSATCSTAATSPRSSQQLSS